MKRCDWPGDDALMIRYHDEEWGTPVHDDKKLFEFMVLDSFQAGLSWKTILHKRENFRRAFSGFDCRKISQYGEKDVKRLMGDAGIIRNNLKINATITNAKKFIEVQKEFGSFDKYVWGFVGNETLINKWKTLSEIPAKTEISDRLSKDLQKRGFKFVGSTIIYAFMQAAGLVDDHVEGCFRKNEH